MIKGIRNQAVRFNNLRRLAVGGWVNRYRILDWVQFILGSDRATDFLVVVDCDSFYPRHMIPNISKSVFSLATTFTKKAFGSESMQVSGLHLGHRSASQDQFAGQE